ncbi:hypothetical protein [Leptospira licerasiae]|uniref:hypothetical protein n=1 Tax=Leptospira licerasiae TaxID=447106 RepID=UPI001084478F|nr:hypothetical protein [Leptospira licerasiae]TGM91145.1 hypothetical protein EHR05_10340 [Leptospira licerasiae]
MAINEKNAERVRKSLTKEKKVEEVKSEKEFGYWMGLALEYNKNAKASKKSTKRKVSSPKKTSKKK